MSVPAPLAVFKDLVLDAIDASRAAHFWTDALGLQVSADRGSTIRLDGPTRQHSVWINAVPEPHTVKNRMHLDVHTGSVESLVELGATVLEEFPRWTMMADPDGGEFCAFVRDPVPEGRLYEIVLDVHDAERIARWWADVLGGRLDVEDDAWSVEDVPGAPFEYLVLSPTDEPKTVKNRVHLDVHADVGALVAAGATVVASLPEWTVLADPEGNEFCAFPPLRG
jgi:catechol 2,3-dioxygenase-like lactoylglutathione lyase family enzyme